MDFLQKFKRFCAGSGALMWLLLITVDMAFLLWIIGAVCHFTGHSDGWISQWLALSADPLQAITRPWTFATYIVTHLSPLHLLFNTLWLFWFGIMLSDVTRNRSIVTLFVGGGVAGGIVYVLSAWLSGYSPESVLTGDSAAVLSVMTATACLMPNRTIGLFLLGEIKLKWIAIVCIAITLIGANGSGTPPQLAHIAGIAFGLLWALEHKGAIRMPQFRMPQRTSEQKRKVNARATIRAIRNSQNDEERLDQLLDKIRISGYESLTAREKTELNHISARIEK